MRISDWSSDVCSSDLLERAGISAGSSLGGHAVIGIVLACFTVLALFVVDRFGRRPVLLTGCAGAAVALALTGICFAIGVTDGAVIIALARKSVVKGKSVSVRVDHGGRRIIKKKHSIYINTLNTAQH